jgi:hypothetical protein
LTDPRRPRARLYPANEGALRTDFISWKIWNPSTRRRSSCALPALVSPCCLCLFATHAQAGRRAHRKTKLYFLPPMPPHRLFAGAPENHPYPSAIPLVCLSRKSPFACPIRYPVQPPLKIAGLFFSLVFSSPSPQFFFNFFFQFRSVAANVPHRMRFSRTSNPSRPSVSVNPSVLSVTHPTDIIVEFSE